ncbi:MAG: hypothetical protein RML36_08120 [Anaerolineae bacterium]|nr:hypothetical protein [Anaerolineae bacterium]MDW8099430.1 hypothetical protein [Anaerolineae bacterium]
MPFTVADFHDLARLLYEHPEWRAEIRRLVLTDEVLELPALIRQLVEEHRAFAEEQRALAEAQRLSEARLARVEAAIERLVEEQRALAEAQRRTEERVGRLEMALTELAEAQRRTEESIQKLSETQAGLKDRLDRLEAIFGATVEDEAGGVLRSILEEKGYRPLAEPYNLALDGEVDVVLPLAAPDGDIVWAVAEAKARLSYSDVRAWAQRMKSAGWQQRLAAYQVPGPFLVYAFGIRVDRSAIEEAERQGIGLLTGQGERVAPKGLVGAETRP